MNINSNSENKQFAKKIILFIAIIITFFMFKIRWFDGDGQRWRTIVETDGKGYYAYLPAIFLYHDLHYDFILEAEGSIYGMGNAQKRLLANGQPGNKYFVGVAVLLTPFFLLAWFVSFLTGHGSSGYNMIFFSSVAAAAIFYLLVALIYLRKLLKLLGSQEKWIGVVLLLLVFATNIFWYVLYEPSMSHIYSFAAVSIFLYYIKAFEFQKKEFQLIFAAAALAIITLIRPINFMVVLGIPFLAGSFKNFRMLLLNIFAAKKVMLLSLFTFFLIVFIQPYIYYRTSGSFFNWPYANEGFDFKHPHFWDGLFSYRKGLFIYTPIMLVAFLFIITYFKKSMFAATSYILSFIIFIWVITSWGSWSYGGAFSLRPVLEFYPLLIIPMAVGLNYLKKSYQIILIVLIFFPLTGFCLFQTYQYEKHILSYDEMNKEKYWKVFLKKDRHLKAVAYPPKVETIQRDSIISQKVILYDFDHDAENAFNTSEYFSGGHSLKLDKQLEYGTTYSTSFSELKKENVSYVEVSVMAKKTDDENEASLILSFEYPNGQIFRYDNYPIGLYIHTDSWEKINYSLKIPPMGDNDIMKVYVWNKSDFPLFIDDMKIELFSVKK